MTGPTSGPARQSKSGDRKGEPPPAPRLVPVPGAAVSLDPLAQALEDLVAASLFELGVEQEQDLVVVHASEFSLPMDSGGPASWAPLRGTARRAGREVAPV